MKHFRYRKVNPKIRREMKQLRKGGLSYRKIAKEFNIGLSTVIYHLKIGERKKTIERANKSYLKLTKEQIRENEKKRYAYKKQYYIERYANDKKFRKRHIQNIQNSFERRREVWKEQNKCFGCGRDKIEKKWKMCERCREKRRNRKVKK